MQQTKNKLGLILASVLTVATLAAAPVSAEHGVSTSGKSVSDDTTTASSTTTESSHSSRGTTTSTQSETETETSGSLRDQAKQLLEDKRQNKKQTSTEARQKACVAHQTEINNRGKNYAAAAQRHLDVFNSIFTKVQAFHDSKQLNVANYDALVATAKAKQTAAQTAVDNLKALDTSIDCSASDPASTVASLKTAVSSARTALQDYRKAIKDVVVALKGASTTQSSDSSSDTTNTTTAGGN